MLVQNQKLLKTCPFDDYLAMPGYSHSSLRNEGKEFKAPTKKMRLGTLVHAYLLTPREYTYEQHEIVHPLASAIKGKLGPLLKHLLPELVVTADFIHDSFKLPYKGRIDLAIPNRLVVDLKVSEMPLHKGVEFFRYDNQLSGYALAINAPIALIVGINPKTKLISIYNVPVKSNWWEYITVQKGDPLI